MTVTWNMLDKARAEHDLAVAERDTARDAASERLGIIHEERERRKRAEREAERLRGAIEKAPHDSYCVDKGGPDCDCPIGPLQRAALQPPDGTEAMFTDAWERPE